MYVNWLTRLSDILPRRQLLYSVHIDPHKRFVYFANPKVGSTTTLATLQALCLDEPSRLEWPYNDIHDREKSPLLSLKQLSATEVNEVMTDPDVFRFGFVRDPFHRLVSAYNDKILLNKKPKKTILKTLGHDPEDVEINISFELFIKAVTRQIVQEMDFHWIPQNIQLMPGRINYSYIGKMESFDKDFKYILDSIFKIPDWLHSIPQLVVLQDRYNVKLHELPPKTQASIWNKYYWDYEIFGYEAPKLPGGPSAPPQGTTALTSST